MAWAFRFIVHQSLTEIEERLDVYVSRRYLGQLGEFLSPAGIVMGLFCREVAEIRPTPAQSHIVCQRALA